MADDVVYRVYDVAGQLLYVGMSSAFASRLGQHQVEAEWWPLAARVEIEHVPSRWHAYQRESELIRRLRPLYNKPPGARPGQGHMAPKWRARDERIVQLRQEGKLAREIAAELGTSERQVRGRVTRLLAAGKITRRSPGLAASTQPRDRGRFVAGPG